MAKGEALGRARPSEQLAGKGELLLRAHVAAQPGAFSLPPQGQLRDGREGSAESSCARAGFGADSP